MIRSGRGCLLGLVCACLCLPPSLEAAASSPVDVRTARLVAVARLWGAIEYFDPEVAGNPDVNWDEAFAKNFGAIEAAGSTAEYAAAVGQMLAALHDPATRIVATAPSISKATGPEFSSQTHDGFAILRIAERAAFSSNATGEDSTVDAFVRSAADAKGIVIDLRVSRPLTSDEAGSIDAIMQPTFGRTPLTSGTVLMLSTRSIRYRGLPSTIEGGLFAMSFDNETGSPVIGTAKRRIPTNIIVNENSEIPPLLLALIDAGAARVVVDGRLPDLPAALTSIRLTEGLSAVVRSADYAKALDLGAPAVTVLPAGSDPNVAIARAIAATGSPVDAGKPALSPVALPSSLPTSPSYDTSLPGEPYRVLAAVQVYNAIRYFSPYTDLMHDDWDAALGESIPEVQRAANPRDYYLAIAKFYAHLHDSHGFISGAYSYKYFGAVPPLSIRYLHGQAVITEFFDRSEASTAGAQIGDVVLAIGGEPTESAMRRWQPYVNASTRQASLFASLRMAVSGENGSMISLLVRTPRGAMKTLTFTRRSSFNGGAQRLSSPYRIMAGNVGYVDLNRLKPDQVDPMFAALGGTRAIVFDDRGYPQGTAWSIAPRLTTRERIKFSLFEIPLLLGMASQDATDELLPTMLRAYDRIPSDPDKSKYLRPTVLLINERTGSQAEYSGMMFRAADNMQFVGTPTVGADGNVTNVTVPGGLQPFFSGASVRWPDGRQTQRVGLQPDVRVEPTAQDVAQGKDVVLLAGLRVALQRSGAERSAASRSVAIEEAVEKAAFQTYADR